MKRLLVDGEMKECKIAVGEHDEYLSLSLLLCPLSLPFHKGWWLGGIQREQVGKLVV